MQEKLSNTSEALPDKEVAKAVEAMHNGIGEVTFLLKAWHESSDSDSVRRQELRKREYDQACQKLSLVVGASKKVGLEINITLPDNCEPLTTLSISKGAYDFKQVHPSGKLAPGEALHLNSETRLVDYRNKRTLVYFGNRRQYLEVAGIAEVLGNGGALVISSPEIPEAE